MMIHLLQTNVLLLAQVVSLVQQIIEPPTEKLTTKPNWTTILSIANACIQPNSNITPLLNHTAIANTRASGHIFTLSAPVTNIDAKAAAKIVGTASGKLEQLAAIAKLDLPNLPMDIADGHIMPTFTNILISMGKMCNAECTVAFTITGMMVHDKTGTLILHRPRELVGAKIWQINT
jgi:hypothetical protein